MAERYGLQLADNAWTPTPVMEQYGKKKRGWYCSPKYCQAWNVCEGKFLHDDVDESEVAVREW